MSLEHNAIWVLRTFWQNEPTRREGSMHCSLFCTHGCIALRSSPRTRGPRLGDVRVHSALKMRVSTCGPGSPRPRGRTERVVSRERRKKRLRRTASETKLAAMTEADTKP